MDFGGFRRDWEVAFDKKPEIFLKWLPFAFEQGSGPKDEVAGTADSRIARFIDIEEVGSHETPNFD